MVGFGIMKKYNCLNIETELQALGPLSVVDQRRSTLIPRPRNIILQHLQNFHCRLRIGFFCRKHPLALDHTSSLSLSKEKNFFSTFFFLHAEYIVAHPPPLTEGGMMIRRAAYLTFFLTTPTEKGNCQPILTSFYFPREIFWIVINLFCRKKENLKNGIYFYP